MNFFESVERAFRILTDYPDAARTVRHSLLGAPHGHARHRRRTRFTRRRSWYVRTNLQSDRADVRSAGLRSPCGISPAGAAVGAATAVDGVGPGHAIFPENVIVPVVPPSQEQHDQPTNIFAINSRRPETICAESYAHLICTPVSTMH